MSPLRRASVAALVLIAAPAAVADWAPGDPYKMHYPQLPDPSGWDVHAMNYVMSPRTKIVADDWLCTETGPVDDIHFWGSWLFDEPGGIDAISVDIYAGFPGPGTVPGALLWTRFFIPGEFSIVDGGIGEQGFYNPYGPFIFPPPDHLFFHQINIESIPDPFIQDEGETYWLGITVWVKPVPGNVSEWGWKTSGSMPFGNFPTWMNPPDVPMWTTLDGPVTGVDLAFVITPEPITAALLGLGGLLLLRRRRP